MPLTLIVLGVAPRRERAVVTVLAAASIVALLLVAAPSGDLPGGALLFATAAPSASARSSPSSRPTGQFYVAPTGSDTAPGSLGAPWLTLQHAADVVPGGAVVFVRAGTYGPFVMKRSGSAAAPTKFAAYPGEKPVIDGRGAIDYTVRFVGAQYLTLGGFTVTGGAAPRQTGGGVSVENSAHITIQENEIHHNHAFGVRLVSDADVLVTNNDIHDNAVGVRVTSALDGNAISANRIHDNNQMMVNTLLTYGDDAGGDGVAIVSSTGRVTVDHNQLWRNRAVSFDYGYDGGAFSIYASSNWTLSDNVAWDNRNVLETGTDADHTACDNGRFVRNLAYGATTVDRSVGMVLRCASNTLVANNTFAGLQYFVFDISNFAPAYGGSIAGLRIVNNVASVGTGKIYGLESALPASVQIDHNVVYDYGPGYFASLLGTGFKTLAAFHLATGLDAHSVAADPLFRSPASGDYSLTTVSPAVDHGIVLTGVTDGFTGSAPDCGYMEARQP